MRKQTCTDHCSTCGEHFHAEAAFMAHLDMGKCAPLSEAVYHKGKRQGQPKLQLWTSDGWCQLAKGCYEDGQQVNYLHPVSIWQKQGSGWGARMPLED